MKNILLVGTPNVGKSSIFNKLTWKMSYMANYDNVTSKIINAKLRGSNKYEILDTPGIYNLGTSINNTTMNEITKGDYESIVNIISASSLKRDLHLSLDLLESGTLGYLVINMIDELKDKNINVLYLERKLKTKVFCVSASKNIGVKILNNFINKNDFYKCSILLKYPKKILDLAKEFEPYCLNLKLSNIFLVTQFLKNNNFVINYLKNINLHDKLIELSKKYKITIDDISKIDEVKNNFIDDLLNEMFVEKQTYKKSKFNNNFFNKLNEWTFNPFVTIFGFIIVLFLIYFITFGQYTGTWISDQVNLGFDTLKEIMRNSMINDGFNEWTQNFFTDGVFDGIFTTLSFVPWIIILSFFTTILEQSGYLSRISITLDSLLERYGISGRSIVNIIMGTGCNVPSIIMTKNSNSRKERIITIMLLPLVSCSARTVVFGWISQAFGIQQYSFILILLLTLFSIIIALSLGLLLSNTLFRKEKTIFISEIIPWRLPSMLIVLKRTFIDVFGFLRRVILVIFSTNIVIFLLSNLGPNGIATTNDSFMYYISYPFRYMLYPTGIYGTWELSISLVSSFPAKEIAATNLEMFFGGPEEFGNALKLINPHLWPAIIASYLSFFLFYLPCFATAITIKKELGWKYLFLNIFGVFLGSYLLSCIIYNIVGSLSTFHYGDYSSANVALFVVQITLFVMFITIYLNRIRLQNKGYIESKTLNIIYKYSFIFMILVWSSLIIANNVLMINTNL